MSRNGWVGLAAAAVLIAIIALATAAWSLIETSLIPSPEVASATSEFARDAERQREAMEKQLAQVNGRSLLLVPGPPGGEVVAEGPAEEPAAPSRYEGPALVAMVNGQAWFSDGRKLEASDEADGDLRVVALTPPWEARVEWRGVEFTVPLFKRDTLIHPASEPDPANAAATDREDGEA